MPTDKLKEYLDSHDIEYETIAHAPAYTAQTVAASAHVPGKELAKTVIVDVDGQLVMAVLPASSRIDLEHLKSELSADRVSLAEEERFKERFPDCEKGAMPPFGNLYGMDVYVARELTEDDEIAFSAGKHSELVKMSYKDYEKLANPSVVALT